MIEGTPGMSPTPPSRFSGIVQSARNVAARRTQGIRQAYWSPPGEVFNGFMTAANTPLWSVVYLTGREIGSTIGPISFDTFDDVAPIYAAGRVAFGAGLMAHGYSRMSPQEKEIIHSAVSDVKDKVELAYFNGTRQMANMINLIT